MIHANDTLSCRHSVRYAKQTSQQFTIHRKAIFPQHCSPWAKICQKNAGYKSAARHVIYKCVNDGSGGILPAQFSLGNQRAGAWLVVSKWNDKAVFPPALEIGKRREAGWTYRACLFLLSLPQGSYHSHRQISPIIKLIFLSVCLPPFFPHYPPPTPSSRSNTPLTLFFLFYHFLPLAHF